MKLPWKRTKYRQFLRLLGCRGRESPRLQSWVVHQNLDKGIDYIVLL